MQLRRLQQISGDLKNMALKECGRNARLRVEMP